MFDRAWMIPFGIALGTGLAAALVLYVLELPTWPGTIVGGASYWSFFKITERRRADQESG